jgi:cytidylate kinase
VTNANSIAIDHIVGLTSVTPAETLKNGATTETPPSAVAGMTSAGPCESSIAATVAIDSIGRTETKVMLIALPMTGADTIAMRRARTTPGGMTAHAAMRLRLRVAGANAPMKRHHRLADTEIAMTADASRTIVAPTRASGPTANRGDATKATHGARRGGRSVTVDPIRAARELRPEDHAKSAAQRGHHGDEKTASGRLDSGTNGRRMMDGNGAIGEVKSGNNHARVIAIDGPAAAGKTTVARALAGRVGAIFLDTGLLYRAVTFEALRRGISPSDGPALADLVRGLDIQVAPPTVNDGRAHDVLVDGEDVTGSLRTEAVDRHVSEVSAHPAVRAELLPIQRRIADGDAVVMVGRDIATVVVPDAGVKIFLDASLHERARRRHHELAERGVEATHDAVLADLRRRDQADSSRESAPLQRDLDAFVVGTDGLSIDQVVDRMEQIVRQVWSATGAIAKAE